MHGVIYYRTDIFAMTHKYIVAKNKCTGSQHKQF